MRVLSFLPETAGMYIKLYITTNPQRRRPYHQHEKDSPSPFWSLSVKEGYRDGEPRSASRFFHLLHPVLPVRQAQA
jgi:hypothetical protein